MIHSSVEAPSINAPGWSSTQVQPRCSVKEL